MPRRQWGYYSDPSFRSAEEELRGEYGGQLTDLENQYARQGYGAEDVAKLTAAPRIQANIGFQDLVGQQQEIEAQRRAARKANRLGTIGSVLGFVSNVAPQIAALRIMSRANPAETGGSAPDAFSALRGVNVNEANYEQGTGFDRYKNQFPAQTEEDYTSDYYKDLRNKGRYARYPYG
jgi:hypothetical protein